MSITIQVAPELESALRQKAEKTGLGVDQFIAQFLTNHFPPEKTSKPVVSKREAALLQEINLPFSPEFWANYRLLKGKRQSSKLSEAEAAQLTQLAEQIEMANASRMKPLLELATLRQVPLREMMQILGIRPESYA